MRGEAWSCCRAGPRFFFKIKKIGGVGIDADHTERTLPQAQDHNPVARALIPLDQRALQAVPRSWCAARSTIAQRCYV